MPALMAWADLAISAAGSTCYELAFMGLPMMLITIADNQVSLAIELERQGCALNLGWHVKLNTTQITNALSALIVNRQERAEYSEQSKRLIDGLGAHRVVQIMRNNGLFLREANIDDSRLVWEWANDSQTRSASFKSESIAWIEHEKWFKSRLTDPQSLFLIAEDELGKPVGQVRFQNEGCEGTISVSIAPDRRGQGYGWRVIQLGSRLASRTCQLSTLHAFIKPDNTASLRSFSKAGYSETDSAQFAGQPALHFTWRMEIENE